MPALPEYQTRVLLGNEGVPLVEGVFVAAGAQIPDALCEPPVYLKAQIPGATSRAAQGLVRRCDSKQALASGLKELLAPGAWGQAEGVLVVNRPESIRNANEKLFAARFPDCMPPSLVARSAKELLSFLHEHGDIILKPLGEMGGASIFRVRADDPNTNVIIETLTDNGARYIMAQRFVPEISAGDKRILLIDGEPVPYALARIPAKGETRGNLAAGGRGEGVELSARDREICAKVGPACRELGLVFVGIDVIGDYLTEINSTSPTCIRELDALYGLNISAQLMDVIEKKLS